MYDGPTRGGTRGGAGDFKWSDVKEDKYRENYLGNTVNAPKGRWQNQTDIHWYTRDKQDADAEEAARREEIKRLKEAEEEALAAALGYVPVKRDGGGETTGANSVPVKGQEDRAAAREKEIRRREKELRKEERALKRAEREARRADKNHRRSDRDGRDKHRSRHDRADSYDDERSRRRSADRSRPRESRERHWDDRGDSRRLDRERSPAPRPRSRDDSREDRRKPYAARSPRRSP